MPINWKLFLNRALRRANYWGVRRLAPGLRTVVGILFIIGGFLGFLPILGFWMIPVGLFLIAMEFPAVRRRLQAWLKREKQILAAAKRKLQAR